MTSFQHLPRLRPLAVALACALVAGCGSGPHAEGNVTFAGQKVDGGGIAFIPQAGASDDSCVRVTGPIRDGHYEFDGLHAPRPGKYRVEITWLKKTGNKVPGEGEHLKDETEQVIPPTYNANSELVADIQPGFNKFDFDLRK